MQKKFMAVAIAACVAAGGAITPAAVAAPAPALPDVNAQLGSVTEPMKKAGQGTGDQWQEALKVFVVIAVVTEAIGAGFVFFNALTSGQLLSPESPIARTLEDFRISAQRMLP